MKMTIVSANNNSGIQRLATLNYGSGEKKEDAEDGTFAEQTNDANLECVCVAPTTTTMTTSRQSLAS